MEARGTENKNRESERARESEREREKRKQRKDNNKQKINRERSDSYFSSTHLQRATSFPPLPPPWWSRRIVCDDTTDVDTFLGVGASAAAALGEQVQHAQRIPFASRASGTLVLPHTSITSTAAVVQSGDRHVILEHAGYLRVCSATGNGGARDNKHSRVSTSGKKNSSVQDAKSCGAFIFTDCNNINVKYYPDHNVYLLIFLL